MNSTKEDFTNDLAEESSPYLLQHAHNPVNWMPWNERTLALAKEEDIKKGREAHSNEKAHSG